MNPSPLKSDNQTTLKTLIDARAQLEVKLDDITQIIEVNDTIIELTETALSSIKEKLHELGKGGGISKQIDNVIQQIINIPHSSIVLEGKEKMREQVLVLFVSAFETYLCDLIRDIGNEEPSSFQFIDKKEKISFGQQLLKDGFTLGDAILEHIISKGASFQDLQSIIRTFKNYLDVKIELNPKNADILILSAGMRHLIIHNSSMVNRKFLNQVKNTKYRNKYNISDKITVSQELITDLRRSILDFADQIITLVTST